MILCDFVGSGAVHTAEMLKSLKRDIGKAVKIKRFEVLEIKFQASFLLEFYHFQDNFKTKAKLSQTFNFCLENV